jgi:hypothetical protein
VWWAVDHCHQDWRRIVNGSSIQYLYGVAALSLWLACGALPAEVAARAGHSVRVLLAVYTHCIPGCDQIASQDIEEALNPRHWPPRWPTRTGADPGNPVRHASVPQLDPAGHS